MKIAIVGLAIPHPTGKELKKKGYTVWTLGRNADPDCDRYYELHGLQTKHLTGCPQGSQEEYIRERPALAMIVGYLKGLGKEIIRENSPKNLNYGKQK